MEGSDKRESYVPPRRGILGVSSRTERLFLFNTAHAFPAKHREQGRVNIFAEKGDCGID